MGDFRLCPRPDLLRGIDTLILAEASMIGSRQLATLMKGCDLAGVARLVLCGDPDQLPPIQSGAPFADMIWSGVVPVARLQTIFRSASGSGVQNLVEAIPSVNLSTRLPPSFPSSAKASNFFPATREVRTRSSRSIWSSPAPMERPIQWFSRHSSPSSSASMP